MDFKKVLGLGVGCLLFVSTTLAQDIGPLTAKYQDAIRNSGGYFIKYNDYTQMDQFIRAGYSKKRKPSAIIIAAHSKNKSYFESFGIGKGSGFGHNAWLEKNNKVYHLDLKQKVGTVSILPKKTNAIVFDSLGLANNGRRISTALGFLIPEEMKTMTMKQEAMTYKYQGTREINLDGLICKYEEYGIDTPTMKRVYRIYFQNGEIVKFSHGDRMSEVLFVSNLVDDVIFNIPKGFVIYANDLEDGNNMRGDMNDLLREKKTLWVVERY